jgi:tetratricopeptide (TPR) repeat protein
VTPWALGLLGLALLLSACATVETGGAGRDTLGRPHHERALALERDGYLRAALNEWKIAGAIDPDDPTARQGQARVSARIEGLVAERVTEGRAALARGSHVEAQRRFLMALALDPANRTVVTLLQNEVRDVEFLTHTVRAGDTLAALAERYYGDRSRSEVIWETNQLPPSPRLVAGTTLKIPEIPGLPFARPAPRPGTLGAPSTPAAVPARPEPAREEGMPEVNPLVAEAREALDRNDYPGALGDLDKLLGSDPGNREGADLKKLVLYRQGKAQLDQKQYDASYKTLSMLARLQPDYEDVRKLLPQTRGRAVEQHYQQGIRLYREEKLPEAIAEWRVVLELDPQHANAKRNIDQAEKLLKGLEQRKKR